MGRKPSSIAITVFIYPDFTSYTHDPSALPPTQARTSFESRLAGRVNNLLKYALPSALQNELRKVAIRREIATRHFVVMERLPEERVELFRQDLQKLVATLRSYGVEPILVTHATFFSKPFSESDRMMLTTWRKSYPMLKEDGFIDMQSRMNEVVRQTAAAGHVPLIDADKEMPPGPRYFSDMVHFTTEGAEVMASILANGMKPLLNSQMPNGAGQVRSANGKLHPIGLVQQ